MNGFEKRTELKKKKILNTAFELFSTYGVQKVSIQEIAHKAQVSQVTIYNYFGSKDQLLYEAVKAYSYSRFEKFQALIKDKNKTFEDKIQEIILIKSEDILQLDLEFVQTLVSDWPELAEFTHNFAQNYSIPLFMELIKDGKEKGLIHPGLSNHTVMFYVDMFYQAMQKHPEMFQTEEQLKQFTNEILHLFFYGIMGNKEVPITSIDEH